MAKIDEIQKRLLEEVADLHDVPEGAYNLRANGQTAGRNTTANIDITSKDDGTGIDIHIKPGTKHESVHIPVVLSESGLTELRHQQLRAAGFPARRNPSFLPGKEF